MQRVTREVWTKRIEEWRASGKSAKEFAAQIGISARTLSWWGWNLAVAPPRKDRSRPSCEKRPSKRSLAMTKPTSTSISPLTFVEMSLPVMSEALEVVMPTSIRVRVRPGFDDVTLSRLMDVLERR